MKNTFEAIKARICLGTAKASEIVGACLSEMEKIALLTELADCQPKNIAFTAARCNGVTEPAQALTMVAIEGTTRPLPVCFDTTSKLLTPEGFSLASGVYAPTLGPDGPILNLTATYKSVSVFARKSNKLNAYVGAASGVCVILNSTKIILLENETVTFSVEDDNAFAVGIECLGDSAALVTVIS